jgi:cell division protein FtsL
MRFALVTSSISALLIAIVCALSVVTMSWIHAQPSALKSAGQRSTPRPAIDIKWGEGAEIGAVSKP